MLLEFLNKLRKVTFIWIDKESFLLHFGTRIKDTQLSGIMGGTFK